MDPRSTLRDAIFESPTDFSRRQVYGDLLQGEGDPRGAFIAAQCRLRDMDPLHAEYPALFAESERLRADHAATWLKPAMDLLGIEPEQQAAEALGGVREWTFVGGFLSHVSLELDAAIEHAAALAELEPIDGIGIRLGEYIPDDQRVFPEVGSWRYLGVQPDGWFTDNSLARALGWGLARVTHLRLTKCSIGAAGCRMLANLDTDLGDTFEDHVAPPPLPLGQLLSLDLMGCAIMDTGLELLAKAQTLASLETLDLTRNRLSGPASALLRASPMFAKLRDLGLEGNNDMAESLVELAGWSVLPQLRRLTLPQAMAPETLEALFPQPSAALRQLELSNNKQIGPKTELVARCAQHFTHLDLGTAKVGDAGVQSLVAAPSAASLTSLELNGCSLSDKAVSALVDSDLQRLTRLDLSSNKLSNAALAKLAAWPGLRHLTYLRLGNNRKLGQPGYQALAESPHFDPAQLDLGKVKDEGSRELLRERFGARVSMRS